MEVFRSKICGMHQSRHGRFIFLTGGLLAYLLVKRIHRILLCRRLRRKVQQNQQERKKEMEVVSDRLSVDGLTIDEMQVILRLPFSELHEKLQKGKLSAQDVLAAYQSRALHVTKTTNSVVGVIRDAQEVAEYLDRNVSVKKGLLHGIPVSLKESHPLAGYNCTMGLAHLLDKIWTEDSVIVKVLKSQGAVPFVRTNLPQTMMSIKCSNPVYGVTMNPHDLTRSPGGSSGGEGSLIASEGSIIGMGTDIGGSIRVPCNMCGIYGLRPTIGRLSPKGGCHATIGQKLIDGVPGPMGQNVDSLVITMEALLTPLMYHLDPTIPKLPFDKDIYHSNRPLRIGYFLDTELFQSVPSSQRAVLMARDVLKNKGHTFVQFTPPDIKHAHCDLYPAIIFGDHGKSYSNLLDKDLEDPSTKLLHLVISLPRPIRWIISSIASLMDPVMGKLLWNSKGLDSVEEWWQLTHDHEIYRENFIQEWRDLRLDALISPGLPYPALPVDLSGDAIESLCYTTIYNVLDVPAGSIPVTKVTKQDIINLKNYKPKRHHEKAILQALEGTEGLPVNVQCVGLPFEEELVLRLMKELETGVRNLNDQSQ